MSSKTDEKPLIAEDLPLTLYLNQRLTFDLLATLEGGFAHFTTVHAADATETSAQRELSGGLGISNVFALVGVQLAGQRMRREGQAQTARTEQHLVHTPASLFARLRQTLQDGRQVHQVHKAEDLASICPGKFVEFKATLRKSPLMDFLSAVEEVFAMMVAMDTPTEHNPRKSKARTIPKGSKGEQNRNRQNQDRATRDNNIAILEQVKAMQTTLTEGKSQDLVAEIQGEQEGAQAKIRAVLTSEQDFYIDPSMNDIIDGTFSVFGKVTRVIPAKSGDNISLLRKTSFGKFDPLEKVFDELPTVMVKIGYKDRPDTRIEGPALQILPIAIFS